MFVHHIFVYFSFDHLISLLGSSLSQALYNIFVDGIAISVSLLAEVPFLTHHLDYGFSPFHGYFFLPFSSLTSLSITCTTECLTCLARLRYLSLSNKSSISASQLNQLPSLTALEVNGLRVYFPEELNLIYYSDSHNLLQRNITPNSPLSPIFPSGK